jgi:hypothetical protein
MAAANMETANVLPKRLGVEINTSCDRLDHPFASKMRWWSRANVPGFSVFQKMRAHARMKLSWNSRWWKLLRYLPPSNLRDAGSRKHIKY